MIDDLKLIKKHYGEKMMHLCRELFSTLLETPGLLYSLMEKSFAPNHYLYDDIVKFGKKKNFKNYIYSLSQNDSLEKVIVTKNPYELMEEAGYILYECKSEEDIQKFKKYYEEDELLCTFHGGRLDSCYVFFAVKKNVAQIRREDFKNPERQDEYGTSVISIQFSRGQVNNLSIKNRYNHRVNNPDATYSNNLDNIIPGLTKSFEQEYGLNIKQYEGNGFEIPGYVLAKDGKYYKYNYELMNVYYCLDNIIIDNFEVKRDYQEKEKYMMIDYFIIDLVNKKVILYDKRIKDSFKFGLWDMEKINITKDKNTGDRIITIIPSEGSEIIIEIDKFNRIIGYKNNNLEYISENFLEYNTVLRKLELSSAVAIGNFFLKHNLELKTLSLPKVEIIGLGFLKFNEQLSEFSAPKLEVVGNSFLECNVGLTAIDLPALGKVGNDFISDNNIIETVNMPKLLEVGTNFLYDNRNLKRLSLSELKIVGRNFMHENNSLLEIELPNLRQVGDNFLHYNLSLEAIDFPHLYIIGDGFLPYNIKLKSINLSKEVLEIGVMFLQKNSKRYELLEQICGTKKRVR